MDMIACYETVLPVGTQERQGTMNRAWTVPKGRQREQMRERRLSLRAWDRDRERGRQAGSQVGRRAGGNRDRRQQVDAENRRRRPKDPQRNW